MRQSVRYERYAQDLRAFLEAYGALVEAVREAGESVYDPGGFSMSSSLDLLPPEKTELVFNTALAAGRANSALTGAYEMKYLGQLFNPVVDWRTSFARAGITPDDVESYVRQLIGKHESEAADAREREGGIIGFAARFLRIQLRFGRQPA